MNETSAAFETNLSTCREIVSALLGQVAKCRVGVQPSATFVVVEAMCMSCLVTADTPDPKTHANKVLTRQGAYMLIETAARCDNRAI